jgi:hypothetical protein
MDKKFGTLCREIFNIEIIVHSYTKNQTGNEEDNDQVLKSKETPSNLIFLNKDNDIQMD